MNWIRNYLLSVTAAAIVCAIAKALVGHKSAHSHLIQLISGIFLSAIVIAPLLKINVPDIEDYMNTVTAESNAAVDHGIIYSNSEVAALIKEKTQAYILDKAAALGADIQVDVLLSDENPPIPERVFIRGTVSPYNKLQLTRCISEQLDIPEEAQIWNERNYP